MEYGICKGIELRKMGSKWLIYDMKKQEAHVINESAAKVLESIDKRMTLKEIVLDVSNQFVDVEQSILNADIYEIVEQYEDMGIIEKL